MIAVFVVAAVLFFMFAAAVFVGRMAAGAGREASDLDPGPFVGIDRSRHLHAVGSEDHARAIHPSNKEHHQ